MNRASILPHHIAIIMDGNGRWARRRGQHRNFGHNAGQKAIQEVVKGCIQQGIPVLTLFAFSSENWQRPQDEVDALMKLFLRVLNKELDALHEQGIRLRFIGDLSAFSNILQQRMRIAMTHTKDNNRLNLNLAVNYGGRWDIVQAARHAAAAVIHGKITVEDINENLLAHWINLSDLPPLDLFIRTSGEYRISNFMLWQIAYAELHFTDTLWPDFDQQCLQRAIDDYARRERRYGRTGEQTIVYHQDYAC